ncbi:hypothetical protein MTYP_00544 [Methylophilaceae bacterium]|nr:hypothetical protein MTYP_00544 [Methylophilaceae bacterium]
MKTLALEYTGYKLDYRINLGDEIQTIAASRLLPSLDGYVSREALNKVTEPCIVSLNGFFMDSPNWPPSDYVVPIPFAFHISRKYEKNICSAEGLEYLKRHAPIGCRDKGTVKILEKYGVEAYYSKCLTLTLDRREKPPINGKVHVVGVTDSLQKVIPDSILKNSVYVNQSKIELPHVPGQMRRTLATQLLEYYKDNASLVITSRIHCAMPCIAMGIPVVFLYSTRKKSDYRVHIIDDLIGINYVNESLLFSKLAARHYANKINWAPAPLNIEEEKNMIKSQFLAAYSRAETFYAEHFE